MAMDPARYERFYEAIKRVLPQVPLARLPAGAIVLRSVGASHKGVVPTPASASTIFGGATADHRWSGARARGAGKGALYVSLHLDALSNELFHYADNNPALPVNPVVGRVVAQDALKATRTFRFKTRSGLALIDLSAASPAGTVFLRELGLRSSVKNALAAAHYVSARAACDAAGDYSFSRALAHAMLDTVPLIDGLKVTTARDSWGHIGETGENLVLFGAEGVPLPYLVPLSETVYDVDPSGKLTQTVNHL